MAKTLFPHTLISLLSIVAEIIPEGLKKITLRWKGNFWQMTINLDENIIGALQCCQIKNYKNHPKRSWHFFATLLHSNTAKFLSTFASSEAKNPNVPLGTKFFSL